MPLEQSFERIAVALEKLAGMNQPQVQMIGAVPQVEGPVVAPVAAPVEAPKEPTEDELRTAVREYMNKAGKEKAIALLVKYGANAEKPMIKDVVNKVAVMQEIANG